jgi:hypothetical protein
LQVNVFVSFVIRSDHQRFCCVTRKDPKIQQFMTVKSVMTVNNNGSSSISSSSGNAPPILPSPVTTTNGGERDCEKTKSTSNTTTTGVRDELSSKYPNGDGGTTATDDDDADDDDDDDDDVPSILPPLTPAVLEEYRRDQELEEEMKATTSRMTVLHGHCGGIPYCMWLPLLALVVAVIIGAVLAVIFYDPDDSFNPPSDSPTITPSPTTMTQYPTVPPASAASG